LAVRAHQHSQRAASDGRSILDGLVSSALTITAILGFIIALLAATVIGYGLMFRDQVYPGVQAVGVNIGGVTAGEAQAALDARTSEYMNSEFTFVAGDQAFVTTPSELGASFDTERTVARAYEFGRTGNWWTDSRAWFDSLLFGRDVGITPVIDSQALEVYFQSIAADVGSRPVEPTFQLSDSGEFQITQATTGLGIDVPQTAQELRSELSSLGGGPVEIATTEVEPAFTEEALDPLGEHLSVIVSEQFILERGGYQWALDAHRLDRLLDVTIDSETGETELALHEDRLERLISSIARYTQGEDRSARVVWTGESFDVRPGSNGWEINVEESVGVVGEAILSGEHRAELVIDEHPPAIPTEIAEEAAALGNELASTPFELTWDEGETQLGGTVVAAALSFEHDEEAGTITPNLNVDDLTMFLSSITPDTDVRPVNADLRYYDGEVVVESEEEWGWEMDRDASAQAIADAIDRGEMTAEIVVEEAEPEITAAMADEIEIREMISYGETYYANSSANRAHNVERATELANGALVPPGGTYSFNESIGGEISEDTGFAPGFGIEGATDGGVTTVPTVGGGVCQPSTTMYQAAFWAGMPIVERNWHMYWMPLYGQEPSGMTGLDATIATGAGLDFKFENATDDWIAIVAIANGSVNRFEIWGTDPGWEIETDGPHITNRVSASHETVVEESDALPAGTRTQVESAHDGFDVEINRWVYDSDGEEIDYISLNSSYQPASNRVLVGTGN
jgi:vancomycin resistance protein YoaR